MAGNPIVWSREHDWLCESKVFWWEELVLGTVTGPLSAYLIETC